MFHYHLHAILVMFPQINSKMGNILMNMNSKYWHLHYFFRAHFLEPRPGPVLNRAVTTISVQSLARLTMVLLNGKARGIGFGVGK